MEINQQLRRNGERGVEEEERKREEERSVLSFLSFIMFHVCKYCAITYIHLFCSFIQFHTTTFFTSFPPPSSDRHRLLGPCKSATPPTLLFSNTAL